MKRIIKLTLSLICFIASASVFAQPGLNVQNRINSKVQTRVQGKVINSAANKAATISQKAAGKAVNNSQSAANKATQKINVPAAKVKTIDQKKSKEIAERNDLHVKVDAEALRRNKATAANESKPKRKH